MRVASSTLLVVALLVLPLLGCGSDGRSGVSGKVTFKGAALENGAIQFTPEDLSKGKPEGGVIKNGKYAISKANGLAPGTYVVQITSSASSSGGDRTPGAPTGSNEPIPERYNKRSELRAVVKAGEKNEFDFPLMEQ